MIILLGSHELHALHALNILVFVQGNFVCDRTNETDLVHINGRFVE